MDILINLLIAAIAGVITKLIVEQFTNIQLAMLLGLLVGILVFFSNPVAHL